MATQTLNALSRASSAYLRSAMHQPIHWYEWSEEAFAAALGENKPILLDIGAVWCHWCHVMDRESYDNPEVAQIINERFIAVKVDRDERPDIDSRYQVAVSAISGQGGWPLTAFLTPDGKPFYGGTYFPPADQWGRPSFKRVLLAISDSYREKHGEVLEQAKMVEQALSHAESLAGQSGRVTLAVVDSILDSALQRFDKQNGGFGNAPKFFHSAMIDLIIDAYVRSGDEQLKTVFVTTLEKMASGGVYDQLAGGFHRYSVDEHWIVPHFEKMSYDNSELLKNYVHAYQATGSEFFAAVARDIIRWMDEWLSDREHGGFYASQDADFSMDDDGDYFTWTLEETRSALNEEELQVATLYYEINLIGQMHHNTSKNVLHVGPSLDDVGQRLNKTRDEVEILLDSAKKKMYSARLQRPTPYVDKTMYVGWNSLCISAYLEAAKVLRLDPARRFALRSLDRLLAEGWKADRGLLHVIAYSDPEARIREVTGVLDDYANTVVACLDAYETTSDLSYFNFARAIADAMIKRFHDPAAGGFFDSQSEEKSLGVLSTRRKPFQDSPTPAGNSVAAIALSRLHGYTNEIKYREKAEETLELLAGLAGKYGIFLASYGLAAVRLVYPHTQVIVIGSDSTSDHLLAAALAAFTVTKSVVRLPASEVVSQNLPPALGQTLPALPGLDGNKSVAVLCSGFACQPPISEPEDLGRALQGGKKG